MRRKLLNFKKEYKDKLISGRKRSTIRLRTNLKEGDEVEIFSGGFKIGVARIVSVRSKSISELTDEDARKDGFRNKHELLKALRKHYGELKSDERVHIIGFEVASKEDLKRR